MGFQAIAIQMGVAWGLGMLNRAMAGRPKRPPKPRPDDLDFPLTRAGTPLPLVYGTVRIDSPVLVWAGMGSRTYQPAFANYRYSADALFVLGVPPQQNLPGTSTAWWSAPVLRGLAIGDVRVSLSSLPGGVLTHGNSQQISISLGGEGAGGFVKGHIEFFDGRSDQLITTYPNTDTSLMKRIDRAWYADPDTDRSLVPGYRQQMLLAVITDQTTIGSDATYGEEAAFPTVSAVVTVVDPDAVNTLDANPAWVLYDLICAEVWKLGYDTDLVDGDTFQAAATTLVTEGNGCSVRIDASEDVKRSINALLAQIDGRLDENPVTGKIELGLIRSDYEIDDLRELNTDNTLGRPRVTQTGWLDNANHVDVSFTNRSKGFKPDTVPAKRLSTAINQNYRFRPRTVEYPYCMTADLAARLAARDAAVLCRPLMTCAAVLSREFYDLRRGDAVVANWPQISVTDKVFRVLDIDRGQLADDGIRVTLIEDVFDNSAGALSPEEGVSPGIDNLPVRNRFTDEAPYWLVSLAYTQGLITTTSSPRLFASGRREAAQSLAVYYSASSRVEGVGSYATDIVPQVFPTSATVATAYPYHLSPYDTSTGLVIEDVTGELASVFETDPTPDLADGGFTATAAQVASGANLLRINDEILAFESVTVLGGGQFRLNNVWRGLLDTVPDDHAVGDVVYFLDYDNVGTRPWSATQELEVQHTGVPVELGDYDPPTDTITISGDGLSLSVEASRIGRPLPGADLRADAPESIEGTQGLPADDYKRVTDFDGSLSLSWRQRNNAPTTIIRGDDSSSYPVSAFASWSILGLKSGVDPDDTELLASASSGSTTKTGVLLGKVGHGEIDVLLRTNDSTSGASWQDARLRVTAHRARNLLDNGGAQGATVSPWSEEQGTIEVVSGTDSLEQTASGKWFRPLTGVVS